MNTATALKTTTTAKPSTATLLGRMLRLGDTFDCYLPDQWVADIRAELAPRGLTLAELPAEVYGEPYFEVVNA
ncbi:MAG TPA: hypothetical protein VMT47_11765 [Polyangia bacterium]|nr:hypothetical protein [Polyangia bacterium]